jgi:Domain of unknown function (DUF397)
MPERFVYVKSRASSPSQECVEVALNVPGVRAIRDSKDPGGPHLEVNPHTFATFINAAKSGRLNHS